MARPNNFSAGPAAMPAEVLEIAAREMLDWHGSGMGVMEMSHRGKEFTAIAAQAEADLRELLAGGHDALAFDPTIATRMRQLRVGRTGVGEQNVKANGFGVVAGIGHIQNFVCQNQTLRGRKSAAVAMTILQFSDT